MADPGILFQLRKGCFLVILFLIAGCHTPSALNNEAENRDEQKQNRFYNREIPNDEGMWLLPRIDGPRYSKMKSRGLQLSPRELYHPDSTSLNQSVVRINIGKSPGGTGFFVSDSGLIISSYHTAYGGIAGASTPENNYVEKGFYSESLPQEIPLKNYSLYILQEQREVTEQINRRLADTLSYREEQRQAQKVRRKIISQRKGDHKNLVVEINEFWGGNRQFLSVYKVIRDVRLVHAPPESIGNFGGSSNNWQWPQHTGGYAFLRAYVGKDGSSKTYNKSNVPFKPARPLRVNTKGIQAGDFVMTMGYPGQTHRHESSYAFEFYQHHRNPILIKSYQAILDALEYAAQENPERALETTSQRAALANKLQYYRGLQRGMEKQHLIGRKRAVEKDFARWVQRDSLRNIKYGRVLKQLEQAYRIAIQTGDLLYAVVNTLNNSRLLEIAGLYNTYEQFLSDSTKSGFSQARKDSLLQRHHKIISSVNIEAQKMMLVDMLHMLSTLPEGKVMIHLLKLFDGAEGKALENKIQQYVKNQHKESIIFSVERAKRFLDLPVDSARARNTDDMIKLYQELINSYRFSRKNYLQHVAYMRPAHERYVEGMMAFSDDSIFYADANSTLRMSTGHIRGYSPKDGIYHLPFTTLEGMLAKNTGHPSFDAPPKLEAFSDSLGRVTFSQNPYARPNGSQAVNFLSTNDVTDGNAGSPVLNGKGELVGISFDRTIEGVTSDYRFNPGLSRSINVDIRYVLFILQNFTGADRLLREMKISGPIKK